ncbi:MAG: hypothetical protein CBD51_001000 [Flavobacteriales bacterium TMED191]|nr:MAG: hypothetical protein CBD51_001000 [Flavobacteriales bacterium TMED191]
MNIYQSFILIPFFTLSKVDTIYFTSSNPFSFKDIIENLESQEEQQVYGVLKFPKKLTKTKIPLIIAFSGSEGWADHHYEYLKIYRELGIATFEVCSFKSRGVLSTVGSQTDITTAMMVLDGYKAFEALSQHININSKKIGITGWSLGGGVTLFSAWNPLKMAINNDVNFAAHLALYPPCIVKPENLNFSNSPIHILIGELDNWTPAQACVDLLQLINQSNIDLTVYPDAHHSFDRNSEPTINKNGYVLTDCRFKMKKNGEIVMNFLNIPMSSPLLQKIGLASCVKRGPTYGGNPIIKNKSIEFSKEFMKKHLLD